uniref:5'-nucleotidase n=1 Tax=Romanomermis culicivorax TaxID=13658 RepID=A0A915JCJ9_ROMCU
MHRMHCRLKECNFGNMVADAMIDSYVKQKMNSLAESNLHSPDDDKKHWAPSAVAIVSSGVFKDITIDAWTNVTMADMYNTLPYANTVELVRLKGSYILEAFEHSVKDIEKSMDDPHGKFLQVAGIRVIYDLSRPNGERVRKLSVRCSECPFPIYTPLDPTRTYNVVTISFVKKGGDGYSMISDNLEYADGLETLDIDVVADFIKAKSPLVIGLEDRITFIENTSSSGKKLSIPVLFHVIVLKLILSGFYP